MKTLSEVQPGDIVYLTRREDGGHYTAVSKRVVRKVRKYKKRTKITLNDNSEWTTSGMPWRDYGYYAGPLLELPSEEIKRSLNRMKRYMQVKWILDNFRDLDEAQVETIGKVVQQVTRDLVGYSDAPRDLIGLQHRS